MENLTEVWITVPESGGRYVISNKGRLRQLGRKERHGKQMLTVFTNQIKEVICDFKTSQMGWYVFLDGEKHFWSREALMELFGDIQIAVITENDQEAIERRNKLFRSTPGQKSMDWSCRRNGDYDEFDPPPANSYRSVYANA